MRLGAQDHFEPYDGHAAPPPPLEVLTDATGRFHAGSLAPGRVDVAARASGGAVQVGTIDVGPDESAWIELRLEPPVRVHGRVLDEEGRPVAHVVVRSAQGRLNTPRVRSSFREPSDQTDGEGSFALEELCAGELSISARHPDGRSARTTLQLAPGSSAECTLVLEHEPSIHGRALSSHGSPLAGWTVRAEPMQPGGPPPRAVFTRADGSFELRFPTRGRVRLELLAPEVRRDDPPRAALDDIEVGARDLLLHANF